MGDWLQPVTYWHWWVLGIVLVVFEIFAPTAFFLWPALAAGLMGLALLLYPDLPWVPQVLIFAVLSVASIALWRMYLRRHPTKTSRPLLNRRGHQYVGRVFTLDEPVVNGGGKIHVDDSTWKITGDDCPAGTQVEVVGVDGVVLKVETRT